MHRFRGKPWAFSSAGSEHLPYKQRVGGSNPSTPTQVQTQGSFLITKHCIQEFGRLAQLVQSICLTSRGSAVRIRQRPLQLYSNFCLLPHNMRAFSSAGSEHLPYKQRVGGSNPSTPTLNIGVSLWILLFLYTYKRTDFVTKR